FDLGGGVSQIFAIALRRREGPAGFEELGLELRDLGRGCVYQARVELAEGIEQRAVTPGVQESAIVVLAVDFDRQCAKVAEDAGGDPPAAREGAAAAIALQRAADDQRLAGIERDALLV